jgi:hypothetical protein
MPLVVDHDEDNKVQELTQYRQENKIPMPMIDMLTG